jgi:hypothetical protein
MVGLYRVLQRRGADTGKIVKEGLAFYEKVRSTVDTPQNKGKIAAINVNQGVCFVVDTEDLERAVEFAHTKFPEANLFFYRVGIGVTTTVSLWKRKGS